MGPFYEIFVVLVPLNQQVLRFVGFVSHYSLKENCNQTKLGVPKEMWDSPHGAEVG